MEFENLLTLIKTVSGSELTSFTMKDGDLKISMGKGKTGGRGADRDAGDACSGRKLRYSIGRFWQF